MREKWGLLKIDAQERGRREGRERKREREMESERTIRPEMELT